MAFNTMRTAEGSENIRPRYTYSPIAIEHNGIHASIATNGVVTIRGNVQPVADSNDPTEIEYDEVELYSNVINRLSILLKDTRKTDYSQTPPRYSHSPVEVEYPHGVTAQIKENGKILLRKGSPQEFDEVEVSASLIYKLDRLLSATRKLVIGGSQSES